MRTFSNVLIRAYQLQPMQVNDVARAIAIVMLATTAYIPLLVAAYYVPVGTIHSIDMTSTCGSPTPGDMVQCFRTV